MKKNFLPYKPTDYQEVKYISYPATVIPLIRGIRVVAYLNQTENKVILVNGDKEYIFPIITKQLFKILDKLPKLIFDGIISCRGKSIEDIRKLISEKSSLLNYFIIDTIPDGFLVNSNIRSDMYRRLFDIISDYHVNKNCLDIKMLKTYKVSTDNHLKKYNNQCIEEGYTGSLIRVGRQLNPFELPSKDNKYHLIKITEKI